MFYLPISFSILFQSSIFFIPSSTISLFSVLNVFYSPPPPPPPHLFYIFSIHKDIDLLSTPHRPYTQLFLTHTGNRNRTSKYNSKYNSSMVLWDLLTYFSSIILTGDKTAKPSSKRILIMRKRQKAVTSTAFNYSYSP